MIRRREFVTLLSGAAAACELVPLFLNMTGSSRARIHLAMDRFDRSMRRLDSGDAAVELSIALESPIGDQETPRL